MRTSKTLLMCGAAIAALTLPVHAQTASTDERGPGLIVITPGDDAAVAQTAPQTGSDAQAPEDGTQPGVMADSDGTVEREADANTDVATGTADVTAGAGSDTAQASGTDGATAPGVASGDAQMTSEAGATAPEAAGTDSVVAQTGAPDAPEELEASPDDGAQGAALASDAPVAEEAPEAMAEAPESGMTPLEGTGALNDTARMADSAGETQRNPDLEELARAADGRVLGATDGAQDMERGLTAGQAMSMLDDMGEAFYERGYRQGYLRGVQDARSQMQQSMVRDRQRMMDQRAMRQQAQRGSMQPMGEQQRMREMARQQAAEGGGLPQIIVVPQGTDLQALMQQLRAMQQGG